MAHRQGLQAVCDRVPRCPTGERNRRSPGPCGSCWVTPPCTLHSSEPGFCRAPTRFSRWRRRRTLPLASRRGVPWNGSGRHGEEDVMRAIVQDAYGSADVLRLAETDKPAIAASEVLVEVRAAGVDRGTGHLLAGQPYLMRIIGFGFSRPKQRVPGLDVAGTVVEVGSGVSRFRRGDEVFGIARGSFAEYAAAREDKLVHKPAGISFEQAAVVAVSGLAAIQGLQAGRVQAGQKVLIIGASGGVGTYAVQLAKAFGAEVTGVCSTGKVDLVRSIGADHVIDYTQEDFAEGENRYDLILDIGGNSPL